MKLTKPQREAFQIIKNSYETYIWKNNASVESVELLERLDTLFLTGLFLSRVKPNVASKRATGVLINNGLIKAVRVEDSDPPLFLLKPAGYECSSCNGTGHLIFADSFDKDNGKRCSKCDGLGRLFGRNRKSVKDL